MEEFFNRMARATSRPTVHPITCVLALAVIIVWAITGPIFGFSDTWQLVINTGTTIATFLMARGPEPVGRRVHGKEAIRKVLTDRFKVIPDMSWTHSDDFIAGNRAVSVWMVRGKSADGEALNYQGCDIYEFRGDKIVNKDTYCKLVEQKDRL